MALIDMKVPSHDAIEQWTLRLGVASMKNPFKEGQRVLWMEDHSGQKDGHPTLCLRVPPGKEREGFLRVDCKATQKWTTDSLGHTLTACRNAANREAKTANHAISTV